MLRICFLPILLSGFSLLQAQSGASRSPWQTIEPQPSRPQLHTLPGNTRGEAIPANDRGRVADSLALHHMLLELRRSPERDQALRDFIARQYDPASPDFHRWLSPAEFGTQYGP